MDAPPSNITPPTGRWDRARARWDRGPDDAVDIANSLEIYNLKQWGFVIFRCTYKLQEKWDRFIALARKHARKFLEDRERDDLHGSLVWTVIHDRETLEGAGILDTSRRFAEWDENEGKQEREGSKFTDTWNNCPRYTFFLRADENSVESVVDERQANDRRDEETWEQEKNEEGVNEDYSEFFELRKKFYIDQLVGFFLSYHAFQEKEVIGLVTKCKPPSLEFRPATMHGIFESKFLGHV
ncbi:hypothetical protein B0H63DRAFT_453945 [Podospora didyma]|uniref:Uncharacterized protein n=1 Tax=Podospora didyma TaxID=330526 RepID=A0AAE0KAW1_9PEZI|nr:hypothetical protein B0H63DRAFT_453945 [Podospora didyma]